MTKARLLVFSEWFPPAVRAGGPVRSIANLVRLLSNDLEISVFTSNTDFGASQPYENLPHNRWIESEHGCMVRYSSRDFMTGRDVRGILDELGPDCVYLNSMFSPRFTLGPLWQASSGNDRRRIVLAPRGMLHPGALQLKRAKKTAFLWAFKATGVGKKLVFHATDQREADCITRNGIAKAAAITIVANVPEPPAAFMKALIKSPQHVRLLYLSRIVSNKNLLFLIAALGQLPRSVQCELSIVGPVEDHAYWIRCQQAITQLPENVRVTAHEPVAHTEVRRLVQDHHCLILPTAGENFGHVIYEALGAARPVIISDQTPWHDLVWHGVGWDLPLSEPRQWAEAIGEVAAMDQAPFDAICTKAHLFAVGNLDTADLRRRYFMLFTGKQFPDNLG